MQLYEPPRTVSQLHQALYALGHGGADVLAHHNAALAVEHIAAHERVAVIADVRAGRHDVRNTVFLNVTFNVLAADILYGLAQLFSQVRVLDRRYCVILRGVLRALGGRRAEHHLRVVEEILVDLEAVLSFADVYPFRQLGQGQLAPLEEYNVRDDVRTRVGAKGVVREPDRAQQLAARGEVAPDALVFGVHRVAARDECGYAARTYLVEHLGGKVVVDAETQLVVLRVKDLVVAERHVADGEVVEAGPVGRLEACDSYFSFRVELLGDAPGD